MSNLFQEVLTDSQGLENKLLGPTKTPAEIGMRDKGTIQQMSKDIDGLIQYVELLVSGKSKASETGEPLGNKFFLKTGAKCSAIDTNNLSTCQQVDRYIYIDNVPGFKGLISDTMENLNGLNPFAIMTEFLSGSNPSCQQITMQTITNDNIKSSEKHYVTLADITSMDPCAFPNGTNPVTGKKCKQGFQNLQPEILIPDDPLAQVYFASLGVLGLFILYRLMEKSR
jgi:hypothetical protein